MKALIVTTDNTIKTIDCPAEFPSGWIAKEIGCDYLEIVRPEKLPRKYVMLIDEEGKLKPNHINPICSWLYGYEHHGDPIVGNAMLLKLAFVNGERDTVGLDDEEVEELMTILEEGVKE